jgi:purine-binding chemotaxis protein CheW
LASTATIPEPATSSSAHGARRTLLFRVGAAVYGCDIDEIREIVPFRQTTRLPGAPRYVQGLINLRGTIVTVLDLAVRLDASRPTVSDGSIMLVSIAGSARLVGIAVQEVMDVRVIGVQRDAPSAPSGADAHTRESTDDVVRGLAQIDGATVILLDIPTLVRQVLLS